MSQNTPHEAPDGPSERLGGGGEGQGVLNADAEALSQVLTEVAFAQIATEQMLTILPIGPNRAQVPAHWRDEAEMRAQPYIEEALAVLPSSEADRLSERVRTLLDSIQQRRAETGPWDDDYVRLDGSLRALLVGHGGQAQPEVDTQPEGGERS